MDWCEPFKPESTYATMVWRFPIRYFFSMLLWTSQVVFLLPGLNCFLAILFPCYLSIRYFGYVLSVPYVTLKLYFYPLLPVVVLFSCILHLHVGRIFFRQFWSSCFVLIFWTCLCIFWVFLLSPVSFDLSLQAWLSDLPAVLFPKKSFHVFPSLALWFVVKVSLLVLLV